MSLKKYRLWDPDQVFLFPPAMRDWLEEDHLVYRLLDVVDTLDTCMSFETTANLAS